MVIRGSILRDALVCQSGHLLVFVDKPPLVGSETPKEVMVTHLIMLALLISKLYMTVVLLLLLQPPGHPHAYPSFQQAFVHLCFFVPYPVGPIPWGKHPSL